MLPSSLNEMASVLNGIASGNPVIQGLAIDSRKAAKGDLFVALTADRDGHDYIANAAERGASAALCWPRPSRLARLSARAPRSRRRCVLCGQRWTR